MYLALTETLAPGRMDARAGVVDGLKVAVPVGRLTVMAALVAAPVSAALPLVEHATYWSVSAPLVSESFAGWKGLVKMALL